MAVVSERPEPAPTADAVAYVIYTHAHADHISGAQVFQKDGALVVANSRAIEPIFGERLPIAVPERALSER